MGGRYRILALDVDGTLLDSSGRLRTSTAEAVARADRAGIRPVLCTGRRYRRARLVSEQLGLDAPVVCNSGALVKDPSNHSTLWRADFDAGLLADILALFEANNEPALSFLDSRPDDYDFLVGFTSTGRALFDDYLRQNSANALVDPDWHLRPDSAGHYHVCAIGSRPAMLEFQEVVLSVLEGRVRTFVQKSPRYVGTMCEILRHDASKWDALLQLAGLWGITPAEICAVGDDMNDLPMIAGAGFGVAMGHAPAAVLAVADHVTGDHDNDGVSMVVDLLLSN